MTSIVSRDAQSLVCVCACVQIKVGDRLEAIDNDKVHLHMSSVYARVSFVSHEIATFLVVGNNEKKLPPNLGHHALDVCWFESCPLAIQCDTASVGPGPMIECPVHVGVVQVDALSLEAINKRLQGERNTRRGLRLFRVESDEARSGFVYTVTLTL